MKATTTLHLFIALSSSVALIGNPEVHPKAVPQMHIRNEPIKPIPVTQKLHDGKVALGRMLFFEVELSHNNTISCSSCHDLSKGGTDRRTKSMGINNMEGSINAPTVFNSSLNFKQFWDGRAATLEEQALGPLLNSSEMGSTWPEILKKLEQHPIYIKSFAELYQDGIKPKNVTDALAEFQRSLITPNSRFDQYLRGNESAITLSEKQGYSKFKSHGCISCHQGVNVGGNLFEPLGAMEDYFAARGRVTKADLGLFNVTGKDVDRFVFKVPSLRNVERTAPYFHDGSALTLNDAVRMMGKYQLGQSLSGEEVDLIVQFLKTLNGEYLGKPL